MLEDLPLRLRSLEELGLPAPPEEGREFREIALGKARWASRRAGLPALADDSGLEVDALGGRPGVRSARYAGPGATDAENNRKLLEELRGLPLERRRARFRCAIALVDPEGWETVVEGVCEGFIALEPRGTGGFGYDPLFWVPEYGRTFAELPPEVKNRISHRGQALRALRGALRRWLERGVAQPG